MSARISGSRMRADILRLRQVSGQRPGDDPLELVPGVGQSADLRLQRGDLGARGVPERRHQQILARAEVVLQGADRNAAFCGHVGEAGGVRAAVRDDPARGLEHRGLPAPGPRPRPGPSCGPGRGCGRSRSHSAPSCALMSSVMPSAKYRGWNLAVMSMTITPMTREPAPIRKIPPIPWKLE